MSDEAPDHTSLKGREDIDYDNLISNMLHPHTLKDIKNVIANLPDEHLEKYVVFKFQWGSKEGTCYWKRKETPKQYWKGLKNLTPEEK